MRSFGQFIVAATMVASAAALIGFVRTDTWAEVMAHAVNGASLTALVFLSRAFAQWILTPTEYDESEEN